MSRVFSNRSSSRRRPSALLSAVLLFLTVSPRATATCYWQNSTLAPDSPSSIAPDDTACFPNQDNSPCCGTGWSCLSDGVCYIEQNGSPFYYRGTCTDRTWNSPECPDWCFAQNANTSIPLERCPASQTGQDWYCCPGDSACSCSSGKDAVKLGSALPTTVTVIGSTTWPGLVAQASTASARTSSSHSATTGPGSGSSTSTDSSSVGAVAGTTTAAASSPSTSTTAPTAKANGSSLALAAGLGAGLSVAAVLAAAGATWFLRRRRRRTTTVTADTNTGTPASFMPEMPATAGAYGQPHEKQADYYATSRVNELAGQERVEMMVGTRTREPLLNRQELPE